MVSSITINNSGSTNAAGFSLAVNSDGSGIMSVNNSRVASSSVKHIPIGVLDYQTLQKRIVAVPALPFKDLQCAKSVSFGFTETVIYKGETSGDLTCSPNLQSYRDVLNIVNTLITQAKSLK